MQIMIRTQQAVEADARRATLSSDKIQDDKLSGAQFARKILIIYNILATNGGNIKIMALNRYNFLEKLGEGGMGAVYTARDRLTQQTVALKQVSLPPDQLQFNASNATSDPYLSLALEFRTLAGLRHPHIISVLDYGFDDQGQPFFTMEWLTHGQPITAFAKDRPLAVKIRLINEMLLALAYLHRRGVLHRDLKPENVLVTDAEQVKVLDFGIASETDHSVQDAKLVGTMAYMAPEVLNGAAASLQSDLYGAGLIMYEILTGSYPYQTAMPRLLHDILHAAPDTSTLDTDVALLLDGLLAKSPDQRPASAEAVIRALCAATGQPIPPESRTIRDSFLQASKFVGRAAEFEQLNGVLQAVLEGENAFYLIGGESGVGKSRLVEEIRTQALVKGITVLVGQGVAEGGLPFQLWRQPARRLALSTRLSDLDAGILKAIVPDISALQERAIPDAPAISEGYQERLITTLMALFRRHYNTILLVLEDLQWTSESLEPLRQMLKIRDQLPGLFVLGTYRDDEKPDLPDQLPGMEVISLGRFSEDAIKELSASMLGESGRQSDVVALIKRETEGNVYFMVEVVRALAENSGRLSDVGNRTLPETLLAGGVQQILQRRLNRLPEYVRTWLKPVAVAGRELDLPVVEQFGIAGAALETYLARCADVAVLELAEGNWRFNHDKLRERLLLDLGEIEKPRLHRQVADAIERVHSDRAGFSEILYDHWRQAQDLDKEIHYLNPVARRLIEVLNATGQARTLVESGLNKLSRADPRRIALLDLHFRTFSILHKSELDVARISAQESLELAQRLGDQTGIATSLKNLGVAACHAEVFDEAEAFFQQSLALSQTLGLPLLTLELLRELGHMNWNRRRFEQSRAYHEQCFTLSQTLGEQSYMARSLKGMGNAMYMLEQFEEAKTSYRQALTLFQATGYKANIIQMLGLLGLVTTNHEEYDQAQAYHEQAIALSQEIGDRFNVALGTINLASTLSSKGDYPQCRLYFEQALAISREIDNQYLVGFTLDALTTAIYRQGAYTEAIPYAEDAVALYRAAGGWQTSLNVAAMLSVLGLLYLKTGDGRARRTFHEALSTAYAHELADSLLDPVFGFVHLYIADGRTEKAVELISLLQMQPSFGQKVQSYLDDHLPDFKPDLSSKPLQAAVTRGQSLDLKAVVEHLLEEFAE